ncbi:AAA family ATPase, partial [Falsiroseomonas oryziterrae]|uniref:AAA family ATPase n=1 Tax=Falsiroseomonas oryziterrae TaxID=2911368 RepID=UPI001F4226CE
MRLLALDLQRYGHLTDAALRFPEEAGLHVVLGANEAGKSTALSAIGDALFGFPHVTRFAFLHETTQLRIGFEVLARDGPRARFARLKRRKDALLDASDSPVPEAALQRFLGGAGRDLFEKGFGLNAAALRDGAKSLIEGGGAAGEGLLAGMGLPHLRRALDRLEKAADELEGTRHKLRRLPRAIDDWQAARRNLDQAAVQPKEWTDAQEALTRIHAELMRIGEEAAALKAEELRLRRAKAVRQPLAEVDRLRAAMAEVADAPALPAAAARTLDAEAAAFDKAARDMAREAEAAEALEAELATLPRDPPILALQDAVDALAAPRAAAAAAEQDMPQLRQDAAAAEARILRHAARLGVDGTAS